MVSGSEVEEQDGAEPGRSAEKDDDEVEGMPVIPLGADIKRDAPRPPPPRVVG